MMGSANSPESPAMGNVEPCALDPALEEILASVDLDDLSDVSCSDVVKPANPAVTVASEKPPAVARSRRREILDRSKRSSVRLRTSALISC